MSQIVDSQALARPAQATTRPAAAPAAANDAQGEHVERSEVGTPADRVVPDIADIDSLAAQVQSALERNNTKLQIDVSDGPPEMVVVSVVDQETGEVLRQFPSEELVSLARNLHAHNTGFLDEEA